SAPFIETSQGVTYSYADLARNVACFAGALQQLGVAKGDRVMAQVEKSPQALFLYLACVQLGAVFVPLNTGYKERELAYFLGDAEPKVLVCAPAALEAMAPLAQAAGVAHVLTLGGDGSGTLAERAAAAPEATTGEATADDIAAIIY